MTTPKTAAPRLSPSEATAWLRDKAREVGFDLFGIIALRKEGAPSEKAFPELEHLPEWLARGYAGEMAYLHDERRADPRRALQGAKSLIVLAVNYNTAFPHSTASQDERHFADSPRGWISRYAWGEDYHLVLAERLEALAAAMRGRFSGTAELLPAEEGRSGAAQFQAKYYVDTGPVIERLAAKYAGLGWIGKNTCLINQKLGSWLFLGVILTNAKLAPTLGFGEPPARDLCGSCTRCLDACPTQAFPAPYVMDARRCISYLTIELRGPVPEELRPAIGSNVFGCDICQDVCPWNRKAPVSQLAAFQPREFPAGGCAGDLPAANEPGERASRVAQPARSLVAPGLEWLASLTEEEFRAAFRKSPLKRAKWRGLVRNACVALGNSRNAAASPAGGRILRLLRGLSESADAIIAEHARWALGRLRNTETGPAR